MLRGLQADAALREFSKRAMVSSGMETPTLSQARTRLLAAAAGELGCSIDDLRGSRVLRVERPPRPGEQPLARAYPWADRGLRVVVAGEGAVISATPDLGAVARELCGCKSGQDALELPLLARLDRVLRASGLTWAGPAPFLVCGRDALASPPTPDGAVLEVISEPGAADIARAVAGPWDHVALDAAARSARPLQALIAARAGDERVGLAGLHRDSAEIWNVGIDVVESWRGRGLGACLAAAIAAHALERGVAPCWSAHPANVASLHTAEAAGFRLALVEVFAVPLPQAP